MNVNEQGRKVQAHDRRCPGRPCYRPQLMALIKGESEEVWKCLGWDGNEEPCPGKLPQKVAYCGLNCESLMIREAKREEGN